MPVTLNDIAKELGISANTVSHALRDIPDISSETTALVKQTASRLGYRKNLAASRLRTNKSYILGIVVTDISNPVFGEMIKSIETVCLKAGYTLMIGNSNENSEIENIIIENMLAHGVDGVFLVPSMYSSSFLKQFESTHTPFIVIQRKFPNIATDYVRSNDFEGGYMAAEHLYHLGHRSFLYVSTPMYISSAQERYNGFLTYLTQQGLGADDLLILKCDSTRSGSYKAMKNWLRQQKDPARQKITAIFCFSDYVALGVYSALSDYGLQIPDDISIIGYDNNPYADMMLPPLTTIDTRTSDVGKQAAELLLSIIKDKPDTPEHNEITISPRLVLRKSTRTIQG